MNFLQVAVYHLQSLPVHFRSLVFLSWFPVPYTLFLSCFIVKIETVDPCVSNPCQNRATCQPSEDKRSFICKCKGSFKPPLCGEFALYTTYYLLFTIYYIIYLLYTTYYVLFTIYYIIYLLYTTYYFQCSWNEIESNHHSRKEKSYCCKYGSLMTESWK